MSDRGDEEDRRLLDEALAADPPSYEYDAGAKSRSGRSAWTWLGLVLVTVLLAMPLLAYVRRGGEASPASGPDGQQLAIALHPEEHVWRDAKTLHFHWNVTLGTMSPDGVEKQVYLVNGLSWPAPCLAATRLRETLN